MTKRRWKNPETFEDEPHHPPEIQRRANGGKSGR